MGQENTDFIPRPFVIFPKQLKAGRVGQTGSSGGMLLLVARNMNKMWR